MPVEYRIELKSSGLNLELKAYRKASARAMRKAGISGQRAMKAETIRRVREVKNLRARTVRKALTLRRSRGSAVKGMSWSVEISGRRVSLMEYRPRQTRRGVTVAVNKGKRTLIPSAFMVVTQSGHKAVMKRRGRARLPIDERLGSRPVDVLLKPGESERVGRRGAEVARKAYARLILLEAEKLA